MRTEKSSVRLSVQTGETVRGYEVKRLPLGEYLRAMEALRDMPRALLRACFPGMDAAAILGSLKRMDQDALVGLLLRAMRVAPAEAVKLLAALTGVSEEALLTDPDIGLDGAAEMIEAFWRLNGLENFIRAAERMAAQAKALRSGYSGSSRRD